MTGLRTNLTPTITDQNGVVTDFRGRMLTSTLKGVTGDPKDRTTTYTYDAIGKLTSITKPLGNAQNMVYDSNNNLTNAILLDASGAQHDQKVMSYDAMSRMIGSIRQSCTTPAAMCSTWLRKFADTTGYTGLDQVASITYPSGGSTTYGYDGAGNLNAITAGDSSYQYTNSYAYDAQRNQTKFILGASSLSKNYDLQFNQQSTAPSNGVATQDFYDDFRRIEKRNSPFSGISTYAYDPAGNLTSTTDGNGATTATNYDVLNRPLVATSTRSGYTTETVSKTCDDTTSGHFGIGRLASMTDPTGSTTYTYERHGLPASVVQVANGTSYTTAYTYDGNANRQTITLPSTRVLTYTYDYADRPASVGSGTATYVSSAAYLPFGPLTTINYGNGTTQTRSFTQRYLPSEIKLVASATTLSDVDYVENTAGYITTANDALNSGYNQRFTYGGRATNMLTADQSGSALWGQAQFSDTFNQYISTIDLTGDTYGRSYNRAGLLTNLFNPTTNTSQAVTEDGAGNELSVGSSSYTYSSRNHLATGDGVSYTYDGMGRRVSATASAGTRTSLYDPEMHLQTETGLSSGAIAYDYIWFAGLPVAQEDVGGSTLWTVTDYRGAPFLQTTSAGLVYWQADYAPFGAVYALRTSDVHQPLRLPGQEAEEFVVGNANGYTGRFYNGFRWYRPLIGRYTQADPIGYSGGGFSLYSYLGNNPQNYIDPFGLFFIGVGAGGGAETGIISLGTAAQGSFSNGLLFNSSGMEPVVSTTYGTFAGAPVVWGRSSTGTAGGAFGLSAALNAGVTWSSATKLSDLAGPATTYSFSGEYIIGFTVSASYSGSASTYFLGPSLGFGVSASISHTNTCAK